MSFPSSEREFDSRHPLHDKAPGQRPGASLLSRPDQASRAPDPCQMAARRSSRRLLPLEPGRSWSMPAGHLPLPLQVRVLIDQRGPLRRLPRAHHRVLERAPRTRRERVPGVTKVVEAEALRQPDLGSTPAATSARRWTAGTACPCSRRTAVRPALLGVPVEMPLRSALQEGRAGRRYRLPASDLVSPWCTPPCGQLRRARGAPRRSIVRPGRRHVAAARPAPPDERDRTRQVDHQAPARAHGVGERVDLGDVAIGPFAAVSLPGALDAAGIAPDQLVVDRCLHDGLKEPVRLGHGRSPPPASSRSARHAGPAVW